MPSPRPVPCSREWRIRRASNASSVMIARTPGGDGLVAVEAEHAARRNAAVWRSPIELPRDSAASSIRISSWRRGDLVQGGMSTGDGHKQWHRHDCVAHRSVGMRLKTCPSRWIQELCRDRGRSAAGSMPEATLSHVPRSAESASRNGSRLAVGTKVKDGTKFIAGAQRLLRKAGHGRAAGAFLWHRVFGNRLAVIISPRATHLPPGTHRIQASLT